MHKIAGDGRQRSLTRARTEQGYDAASDAAAEKERAEGSNNSNVSKKSEVMIRTHIRMTERKLCDNKRKLSNQEEEANGAASEYNSSIVEQLILKVSHKPSGMLGSILEKDGNAEQGANGINEKGRCEGVNVTAVVLVVEVQLVDYVFIRIIKCLHKRKCPVINSNKF